MELSWIEKAKYYSYLVARPPPTSTSHINEELVVQKPSDGDDVDFSTQASQGLFEIF